MRRRRVSSYLHPGWQFHFSISLRSGSRCIRPRRILRWVQASRVPGVRFVISHLLHGADRGETGWFASMSVYVLEHVFNARHVWPRVTAWFWEARGEIECAAMVPGMSQFGWWEWRLGLCWWLLWCEMISLYPPVEFADRGRILMPPGPRLNGLANVKSHTRHAHLYNTNWAKWEHSCCSDHQVMSL